MGIFTATRVACLAFALALVGLITVGTARADSTLEKVKAAGGFSCGVPTGTPGYAQPDAQGVYSGFDIDICKALSAAIFGDPGKVKYVPLTAQQRFTALQSSFGANMVALEGGRRARGTPWSCPGCVP